MAVEVETNSTTGRICPSLEDVDEDGNRAVFSTKITFKRSSSSESVEDSVTIAPSTTGDVPMLVAQLSAESNLTSITVSETVKGVTDDVREVQVSVLQPRLVKIAALSIPMAPFPCSMVMTRMP